MCCKSVADPVHALLVLLRVSTFFAVAALAVGVHAPVHRPTVNRNQPCIVAEYSQSRARGVTKFQHWVPRRGSTCQEHRADPQSSS